MDTSIAAKSPSSERRSNDSSKSFDAMLNNNGTLSESHTPPLPNKFTSPEQTKIVESAPEEAPKPEEKPAKKANEWDMFAEADNIGDYNVIAVFFLSFP